jgi:hypothetical protein
MCLIFLFATIAGQLVMGRGDLFIYGLHPTLGAVFPILRLPFLLCFIVAIVEQAPLLPRGVELFLFNLNLLNATTQRSSLIPLARRLPFDCWPA